MVQFFLILVEPESPNSMFSLPFSAFKEYNLFIEQKNINGLGFLV